MFLKFSVKVKVMNNVNFPERDLLFYIYASLVVFLEWITYAQTHLSIKRDWREFLLSTMELQRFFLHTNAHHVTK